MNSHDPLRGHVLKHIRQNSLTSVRYSVADEGKEERKPKPPRGHFVPTLLDYLPARTNTAKKRTVAPTDI
jgi:hypothetical protein